MMSRVFYSKNSILKLYQLCLSLLQLSP